MDPEDDFDSTTTIAQEATAAAFIIYPFTTKEKIKGKACSYILYFTYYKFLCLVFLILYRWSGLDTILQGESSRAT